MVFERAPLVGETFQTTTLDSYGLYTVEVSDPTNGCSYMSRVHLYAATVGVNNFMKNEIGLYPNPSSQTHLILVVLMKIPNNIYDIMEVIKKN